MENFGGSVNQQQQEHTLQNVMREVEAKKMLLQEKRTELQQRKEELAMAGELQYVGAAGEQDEEEEEADQADETQGAAG